MPWRGLSGCCIEIRLDARRGKSLETSLEAADTSVRATWVTVTARFGAFSSLLFGSGYALGEVEHGEHLLAGDRGIKFDKRVDRFAAFQKVYKALDGNGGPRKQGISLMRWGFTQSASSSRLFCSAVTTLK